MITRSRYLPVKLRKIVYDVIQRNAYFVHPESMLLAMMSDEDISIRQNAFKILSISRNQEKTNLGDENVEKNDEPLSKKRCSKKSRISKAATIRVFKPPILNFEANKYSELIDWESQNEKTYAFPPALSHLSNEQIKEFVHTRKNSVIEEVLSYPCHTQSVERAVKDVTAASITASGNANQEGFVQITNESRKKMPKFKTKANYHCHG